MYRRRRISLASIAGAVVIHMLLCALLFLTWLIHDYSSSTVKTPAHLPSASPRSAPAPVMLQPSSATPLSQPPIPPAMASPQEEAKTLQDDSPLPLRDSMLTQSPRQPKKTQKQHTQRQHAWYRQNTPPVTSPLAETKSPHQERRSEMREHAARLASSDIQNTLPPHPQNSLTQAQQLTQKVNQTFSDEALRQFGRRVAHKIVLSLNSSRIAGLITPFNVDAIITIAKNGKVIQVVMDPEGFIQNLQVKQVVEQIGAALRGMSFDKVPDIVAMNELTFPCTFSSDGVRRAGDPLQFVVRSYGYW